MTSVLIVGFDRYTEQLALELPLPPAAVTAARKIANVPPTDPDIIGAYPLTQAQVRQIADIAHIAIDPAQFDYFLEAYAQE